MRTERYTLDVHTAENGWVIYAGTGRYDAGEIRPAWICANDESLAETIAAALVAMKLDAANNPTISTQSSIYRSVIDASKICDGAIDASKIFTKV
jgi:hypothetical protein